MMTKILIPPICCRCGLKDGTSPWEMSVSKTRSYYVANKTITYDFVVGVCEPCLNVLQESNETLRSVRIFSWTGSIPLGIIFNKVFVPEWKLLSLSQENFMIWGGAILMIFMVGFILDLVANRLVKGVYDSQLMAGSAYSMKLKFKSSEFHRQFKTLNPTISD